MTNKEAANDIMNFVDEILDKVEKPRDPMTIKEAANDIMNFFDEILDKFEKPNRSKE